MLFLIAIKAMAESKEYEFLQGIDSSTCAVLVKAERAEYFGCSGYFDIR